MNNIYKVIWSKAKNCYVVASEIARSHTKSATGSEKIGGVTRRSLLASLMALSLLCGGLGVASAANGIVHVAESAAGTAEVYTTEKVDTLLKDYGKKTDVEDNKNNIAALRTTTTDQGKLITENATNIARNTDAIDKKIDTVTADARYATRTEVDAKADKTALDTKADKDMVTALDGRVGGVEGKVTTLEGKVGDASSGLVKDVADLKNQGNDLNNALGNKADQSDLDAANEKITNLETKTGNLSTDGKSLTGMDAVSGTTVSGDTVNAGSLNVTGEISNGNGVTTTLEKINASMEKTNQNADKVADLEKKTSKIDYDAANDKTTINGVGISNTQVDMGGKDITNARALTATGKVTGDGVDAGTGAITGGSLTVTGKVTGNGVDAGAGDITTTGNVKGGTLETTGDAKIGGDLTVNGKLNVDEISMKNDRLDPNGDQHHSATTITADGISNNAKVTDKNGVTTESKFTHDKEGSTTYAKKSDATNWKESTSNVTADGVSNKMTDSAGNTHTYYQTATESKEQLVNGDKSKSNFEKKTAEGNTISITEKDAAGNPKSSLTNTQTVAGEKTSVTNKDSSSTIKQEADQIRNNVTSADGKKSSTEVKADGITNTSDGTITNDANHIENKATTMKTTVTGKATESYGELETTVNGQATENFKGGLNTTVTGAENHTVTGKQINTVGDGQINNITGGQKNNILTGNQETTVSDGSIINKAENGDISNTAKNVTNEGTESVTNKVRNNEVKVSKDGVDITAEAGKTIKESVGADTSRTMTDGRIIDKAGDMTVTTDKTTGTTFGNGTPNDTTVINGGTIGTNKVNANETNTKKLTAGAAADADGGRLTVDAKDGVKGSYKSGNYTSKSYILANTLKSGVDNGKEPTDADFVGSRTDHYMDGDKAKLDETVKDADGSNVTNKTSTSSNNTIADKNGNANTVVSTVDGTKFTNTGANTAIREGTVTDTTITGNTITTGQVKMDYAQVMRDLGVNGNANIDGKTTTGSLEVKGESKLTGKVTMESDATVGGKLDVTGKATFSDDVDIKKNLSVVGDVTAKSYNVDGKTYIDANGIHANGQKITDVADGSISEGSKDAVNGGQLYNVKNDLEGKVNKVGANAAAMANLHPMEFDPDSKWNIAAAIGNYGSETAAALGAFYRPNDDVMVNLSTAFGTGENMVGGGVSVRLGKGGNKLSREESNALKDQVNDLTARMDALLSVLNPNMSKDFPDVPENHWAYEAVSRLAGNDIVQGYPDGEFHGERTMTRYEMAEIIYNALSRGAEAERELVEEFKPELQAMAASEKATAEKAEG